MNTQRRKIIGWTLYDFANSSYHLLIPSVLMPLFFRQYLMADSLNIDFQWALLIAIPVVFAGIFSPFIGAFSDEKKCRLRTLIITAVLAMIFAALIPMANPESWVIGAFAFGISYFFFTLSLGIYDAFLPIFARKNRGKLSGMAWGLGYLGGIVSLCLIYPLLSSAQLPEGIVQFRWAIWITCLVFAAFSIPSFLLMKERTSLGVSQTSNTLAERFGLARIAGTLKGWRQNKNLFKTLFSYYLANDGLSTLVYFTSIYAATTLHFDNKQILVLFIIVQLVGIPSSIIGGILADKIGHKKVIYLTLGIWIILCVGFALCSSITAFYILAIGTGLVIGTTPSIYRSYLAEFVDIDKAAEIYGFNSFASRASSVAGPILFAIISSMTGSQRPAMLCMMLFFLLAGIILKTNKNIANNQSDISLS